MARIRSVKPDLFKSATLRNVPLEARYLAIGLLTEADDEGRFIASAKLLAGSLFPHDEDVTAAKVDRWLSSLEEIQMVELYEADGVRYGCFPKWEDHQRISHPTPSRLPSPVCMTPELFASPSALNGNREVEQGKGTGKAALRAAFAEFWQIYPRKVGKRNAQTAFERAVGRADSVTILTGARRYASDPNRASEFTAHPATWLNRDGWEDEPEPVRDPRGHLQPAAPPPARAGDYRAAMEG